MRTALILAAATGLLAAGLCTETAWGQQRSRGGGGGGSDREKEVAPVGSYAPSIEAAEWLNVESEDDIPSLVELRGMVVVLFFWVSWHEGGELFLPYANVISYTAFGRNASVYLIGVTDAKRAAVQPQIEKAKVLFPVAVESKSAKEYGLDSGFGFVVIDAEGKIAFKGSGANDLSGMVSAVEKTQEEKPPFKTHPEEAKVCYRMLDEACDLIRAGKYPVAFLRARDVFRRSVLGDRLTSRSREVADLMEILGQDRFAQFEPLMEQKQFDRAAETLREVVRRFRRLECYREAKALYEKLEKENEAFKQAAERFKEEDAAARLYLEARDALKARRIGQCFERLNKIVTDYPRTEAAEYADAMLERMERNKDLWLLIGDHKARSECQQLLARARNLVSRGRYDEAEKILRQIIQDHPNTVWVEEAVEELKKLPHGPASQPAAAP